MLRSSLKLGTGHRFFGDELGKKPRREGVGRIYTSGQLSNLEFYSDLKKRQWWRLKLEYGGSNALGILSLQ